MPRNLIIDTDPGVDDAFAIALAARSAEINLLGVTTVFGNVGLANTTHNARGLLALCGRHDVPVAAGAAHPLVYPRHGHDSDAHGTDGLSGTADRLPAPRRDLAAHDAVDQLRTLLETVEDPVTIAAIGPLTNIAALLAAHPAAREKIAQVVVMGGASTHGNVTAAAEFNIHSDPEAAHRVLGGGDLDCVLVPLELTHRCAVGAAWLDELATAGTVGAALEALTPQYRAHYRRVLGREGIVLHDAVALAEAIRPGMLRTESFPIEVDCSSGPARGATIVDQRSGRGATGPDREPAVRPVRVATDTDIEELSRFVLDGLAGGS